MFCNRRQNEAFLILMQKAVMKMVKLSKAKYLLVTKHTKTSLPAIYLYAYELTSLKMLSKLIYPDSKGTAHNLKPLELLLHHKNYINLKDTKRAVNM